MPAVGPQWEYSMVIGSPLINSREVGRDPVSRATICYATARGCRNEEVTVNAKRMDDGNEAIMTAAARLGDRGWELADTNEISTERHADRILYFKRLKSAVNRSESQER
jgi:hypothetical protein